MAKRFRFRLQALLRLREQTERQRQRELAELLRAIRELEDQVRRLDEQIRAEDAFLRDVIHPGQALDLRLVGIHRRYVMAAQRRIFGILSQLAGVRKRAEAARQRLVEATQAKRALEIVRDKQKAAYMAALSKAEDRMLDEVGLNLSIRQSRQRGTAT
jgi:flagellar FliJ protein